MFSCAFLLKRYWLVFYEVFFFFKKIVWFKKTKRWKILNWFLKSLCVFIFSKKKIAWFLIGFLFYGFYGFSCVLYFFKKLFSMCVFFKSFWNFSVVLHEAF